MSFELCCFAARASAQQVNPVYTDDSPVARDTLARVSEFVASGNEAEAVRELQRLLEEQPDRVVAVPGNADTFVGVRARVHAVLLTSPRLLERYRAAEGAKATQELAAGHFEAVERSRLLTGAGLEAALRVAQSELESGRLDSARLALEQLEEHPDRKAGGAKDAAEMMALVARYLDRPAVWERADRWTKEAGAAPPKRATVERPAPLRAPVASLAGAPGPIDAAGLPSRPLWSTRIEAAPPGDEIINADEEGATPMWASPLVVGDALVVNDGSAIAARDRFTLQVRWTYRAEDSAAGAPSLPGRGGAFRGIAADDPVSAAVHGRIVVAGTGGPRADRDTESVVHALDLVTGKPLWSKALSRADPQLEGAALRGTPIIDGGTVILGARKSSQGRRIATSYLVGLSLEDGATRWVRPIASAGSYPFGAGRGAARAGDWCTLSEGVVYCVDPLGAAAAVEAGTGRVRWVRTMPTPGAMGMGIEMTSGWFWSTPVVDATGVIIVAPDRSEVVRLDASSGATLGRRPAGALGEPYYLVRVNDALAVVGRDSVVFVPVADFEHGQAHRMKSGAPIIGRVLAVGDRLLVPLGAGAALVDPANPTADPTIVKLERPGNVLPLESELLVVDGRQLHSYLAWSVAEKLLEARMTATPGDAEPAITYAELAYRAQHPERIAPAADKAIAAIERAGASEAARAARVRLFGVLRDMAEYSESKWEPLATGAPPQPANNGATTPPPPPPPVERPGMRRGPALVKRPPQELPVLDLPVLAEVVERLGRVSQSPDERVSHLMVLGRLREAEEKPGLAAEAYQRVLAEPALAQGAWRGPSVSVRGELEATRRIRHLAMERGAAAYAAFDTQAERELELLGAAPSADALERLARQYPAAAASGKAWMRAAEAHESAGHPNAAAGDLREGLSAAETAMAAGSLKDQSLAGELAGRLVVRLQKLDQLFAAAQLLARVHAQYPELALADHGTPLDAQALSADLVKRLASLERPARIGAELRPEAQAIAGWQIMATRSRLVERGRTISGSPEHVMMISPGQARIGLWGVSVGGGGGGGGGAAPASPPGGAAGVRGGDAGGTGAVQLLWSRSYSRPRPGGADITNEPPALLRVDPESVYLFWEHGDSGEGPVLERIATVTGETRWKTEPFTTLFPADGAHQRRLEMFRSIDTPIDGPARLSDCLVAMDEQVVAMVERSGRAAVFEAATGKLLWRAQTAVGNVHDIDAASGLVAIGGAAVTGEEGAGIALAPLAVALDARSGQVMHKLEDLGGQQVRWVRLAGAGEAGPALVLGLESQVQSFDPRKGTVSWTILGGPAAGTLDAWIMNDRVYLLAPDRTIYAAPLATGALSEKPLDTYEHLVGSGPIYAWRVKPAGPGTAGGGLTAFSTLKGVCIFDGPGTLVGIDALEGEADEGLLPPVPGEGVFVTAETSPHQGDRGQNVFTLHILESPSAMLRASRPVALELPPKRLALLDGKILITAGGNTVVYSAPVQDGH